MSKLALVGCVALLLFVTGCCCCGGSGPCEDAADACYEVCNNTHTLFSDEYNQCFEDCAADHFDCSMSEEGF